MAVFTQGITTEGAAILKDGVIMTVEDVIFQLNTNLCVMNDCETIIKNDRLLCKKHFYNLTKDHQDIIEKAVDLLIKLENLSIY